MNRPFVQPYQLKELFEIFLESEEALAIKYDRSVLLTIFKRLVSVLEDKNERRFPLSYLIENVKHDLSQKKLTLMNLEDIIRPMMDFLCGVYGLVEDSFRAHRDEGKKVIWQALARHTNNPSDFIECLFNDIIQEFEKSNVISINEIANIIHTKNKYKKLSDEAVYDAVEALFDFFTRRGLIGTS